MKSLIVKDIKLTGFVAKFFMVGLGMIYTLIISALNNIYYTFWGYLVLVIFFVGLSYFIICNLDLQTDIDTILNSLPIEKGLIVKSRYSSVMIYILSISFMVPILSLLIKSRISMPDGIPITIGLSFHIIGITTLLYSIYIPLDFYHRGDMEKVREIPFTQILILILIAVFSMKQNNIIYRYIKAIDINSFPIPLILFSILVYLISMNISINIYRAKEF